MKSPTTKRELTAPFIKAVRSYRATRLEWDTRQPGLVLHVHRSSLTSILAIYRHAG